MPRSSKDTRGTAVFHDEQKGIDMKLEIEILKEKLDIYNKKIKELLDHEDLPLHLQ